MKELDPVLLRQLRRLGLETPETPPSAEQWQQFLERISDQYVRANEDRAMLTRTLEVSTNEMSQLRTRVETERDRLQSIVEAVADAIVTMGGDSEGTHNSETTNRIVVAKQRFAGRVNELFGTESHSSDSTSVRKIESGFLKLADQLERMMREMTHTASLKKELEVARTVQQMLLPPADVLQKGNLSLAAYFQPAQECGGDWWHAQEVSDGKVMIAIGDVTGHGIASAILTGVAKAAADIAHLITRGKLDVNVLLHLMNHAIFEAGRQQVLMTAAACLIDPQTRTLTYGNAGHGFPLVIHDGAVRPLVGHGPPLGTASLHEYATTTATLEPGDLVLWFTDGVTERENESGEQFSDKRLKAACARNAHLGAASFRDDLVHSLSTFAGRKPPADDATMIVARLD